VKFKKYKDCVDYLFGLERAGVKYDLINIKSILKFLNNPQNSFKSIHIAGTNGKGSVASIINSVLIEKGFKTGLYTSPHILDYRERILVNSKYISKKFILDFTNKVFLFIKNLDISFFEVTTAMAFEYFRFKKVNYAVIETGLGGRLDSTNILNPLISVITGISIDHTEYLGNTISSIANEKAGIIKNNTPCVIGKVKNDIKQVFILNAKRKNSKIIFSDKFIKPGLRAKDSNGIHFQAVNSFFSLQNIFSPIIGKYQLRNIATVLTVLSEIQQIENVKFNLNEIRKGFKNLIMNSKYFGRFQQVSEKPKIIIDVSHNTEAIKNLVDNLDNINYKKLFVIFGIMKEKNYLECLKILKGLNAFIIFTKAGYKRALDPALLYNSFGNKNKSMLTFSLNEAYDRIKRSFKTQDLLLVTGSFFVVSDFLKVTKLKLY
jgi:dihydrofolate synthase/folylpolyglutamate synthase